MTPEERRMLEETYRLTEENAEMLRGIKRAQEASTVMRIVYWLVIIAMSIAAFYLIQPYLNSLGGSLGSVTSLGQ